MASPDDAVLAACKQKLGHFRIKELKDVLHQLGLPKHGKKQELVERVMTVLSDQQNLVPETNGLPKDQEKAVKIVEDTFMKMQDPTGTVAASRSHIVPKKKPDDPVKVCCPCGNSKPSISMIKCVDPQCNVWQHVGCVIIPENEKPVDSISPDLTSSFYCEICRINRADPFWVTVNNVLLPVIVGPSPIAADGSYTVQSATGDLTAPRHATNPCCLPTTPAPALRQPTRPDPAPLPPSDSSCSTGRSVWLSASQSRNIVS